MSHLDRLQAENYRAKGETALITVNWPSLVPGLTPNRDSIDIYHGWHKTNRHFLRVSLIRSSKEAKMSEQITELGLVISVPASFQGRTTACPPDTQSIRVQMNALGGEIYLATLSVEAAKGMLIALGTWPPLHAFLQELSRTAVADASGDTSS